MKTNNWSLIEIKPTEITNLEVFLKTIKDAVKFSAFPFSFFKHEDLENEKITYYIGEPENYLYDLIKYRYPQITSCMPPKFSTVTELILKK